MSEPIVRLAARGDGVTADGRAVPLAAPSDRVDVDGTIVAGPHRQSPPCRHFPACGGCDLQHVDDAAYADFLVDRVAGALRAHGLDAPIAPPHLSPPYTRRRTALRAERTGRRVVLGFNERASRRIVDVAQCPILLPALCALLVPLRGLLARLLDDRRGCEVRLTRVDQGIDVLIQGCDPQGLAALEAIAAFAAAHRLARLAVDRGYGAETLWEPEPATVTLGGAAVAFPPGGFVQATADGEAALLAGVRAAIGNARTVADLFAGLGTFALPLAADGARVLAAEGARDAVLALRAAGVARGVLADHRDLFRRPFAADELSRFDAVVLDPPRAGAKEQGAELARATCGAIAYVSCNPSTFARDAAMLVAGGWRLAEVRPVGQFRWSTHVELVARFAR